MWGCHGDSTAHRSGRLLLESDSDMETVLLGLVSFRTLTRPWEPPRAGGAGVALRLTGTLWERGWPPRVWVAVAHSCLWSPRAESLTKGCFRVGPTPLGAWGWGTCRCCCGVSAGFGASLSPGGRPARGGCPEVPTQARLPAAGRPVLTAHSRSHAGSKRVAARPGRGLDEVPKCPGPRQKRGPLLQPRG